jgi:hypothetical protein
VEPPASMTSTEPAQPFPPLGASARLRVSSSRPLGAQVRPPTWKRFTVLRRRNTQPDSLLRGAAAHRRLSRVRAPAVPRCRYEVLGGLHAVYCRASELVTPTPQCHTMQRTLQSRPKRYGPDDGGDAAAQVRRKQRHRSDRGFALGLAPCAAGARCISHRAADARCCGPSETFKRCMIRLPDLCYLENRSYSIMRRRVRHRSASESESVRVGATMLPQQERRRPDGHTPAARHSRFGLRSGCLDGDATGTQSLLAG